MLSVRLAAGAVVGATDLQGATALHHAARKGVAGSVRQLLDAGAAIGLQPGNMGLQLGVHRVTGSCIGLQARRWTPRRARRGARHFSWRRGMASCMHCRHSGMVSQSIVSISTTDPWQVGIPIASCVGGRRCSRRERHREHATRAAARPSPSPHNMGTRPPRALSCCTRRRARRTRRTRRAWSMARRARRARRAWSMARGTRRCT